MPPCRGAVPRRSGRRARRCCGSDRPLMSWSLRDAAHHVFDEIRPAMRRGEASVHRARARGDASGNAPLHVAPPAAHAEAEACDRASTRPAVLAPRDARGDSRRCGDARRRSRSHPVRLGQRVRRATGRRSGVRDRRAQRDERGLPRVRRRQAGITIASCGRTSGWAWRQQEHVEHPIFWERKSDRWFWRGMFELHSAAAGVAGVRQLCRSRGVRALARSAPADRGRVSPRRIRDAVRRRAIVSVGRGGAGSDARQLRFRELGTGARRLASRRRERVGCSRSRRQRMGVDVDGVRSVSRIRARWPHIPSTRPSSSTVSTTS